MISMRFDCRQARTDKKGKVVSGILDLAVGNFG